VFDFVVANQIYNFLDVDFSSLEVLLVREDFLQGSFNIEFLPSPMSRRKWSHKRLHINLTASEVKNLNLETYCETMDRTATEVIRELVRSLRLPPKGTNSTW